MCELTFNPSRRCMWEGIPLLKDIKAEQPVCLIMCLFWVRLSESLVFLRNQHLLKIEPVRLYFSNYARPLHHSCDRCIAFGLCSRTNRPNSCSISFSNNIFGNEYFSGSLWCCYISGWSTRWRDLFLLCAIAPVCHLASHASGDQRAFEHYYRRQDISSSHIRREYTHVGI